MTDTLERLTTALADRYVIERELGAGGMATVYLAHDIRHDRKVALKVLRPELSAILGAERFLAEIKTTANLQHPHILSLFDSGTAAQGHGGTEFVYYVMPYVEGESLRDRLTREKQLPIEDAVRIAREVADALEYAHQRGVIHRDIKPENILLHGGHAQVADFGIALAVSRSDGGTRMTETGMSLGTPHYMSPEQAMGQREITPRADIYALGCVLYEMLVGEPPFMGPTAQAIIARVMTEEPRSLTLQRHTIPPHVEAAVRTALEKLPADRFASAEDFAEALSAESTQPLATTRTQSYAQIPKAARSRFATVAAVAGWLVAALAFVVMLRTGTGRGPQSENLRFALALPDSVPLATPDGTGQLAVTSDGRNVVYRGRLPNGTLQLYRVPLDGFEARPIPGTEGAVAFYVAPDGRNLAIVRECRPRCSVVRMALDGTGATTLSTNIPEPNLGSWSSDSALVIAANDQTELLVVPATPGEVKHVTIRNFVVEAPRLLPGGKFAIATVMPLWQGAPARWHGSLWGIGVVSLEDGTVFAVTTRGRVRADSAAAADWLIGQNPIPVRGGQLFYVRLDGSGAVAGFDPERGKITTAPRVVLSGFFQDSWGNPALDISAEGTLVYAPGHSSSTHLGWLRADGRIDSLPIPPSLMGDYDASPDGKRVVVSLFPADGPAELRIFDVATGSGERIPDEVQTDVKWTADGTRLLYGTPRGMIVRRRADRLIESDSMRFGGMVMDASRDGSVITVSRFGNVDRPGLWVVPWGSPERAILIDSSRTTGCGLLSPDGTWVWYRSSSEGTYSDYAAPIADPAARRRIPGATVCGAWSANGIEEPSGVRPARRASGGWEFGALLANPHREPTTMTNLWGWDDPLLRSGRWLAAFSSATRPITRFHVARGWVGSLRQ